MSELVDDAQAAGDRERLAMELADRRQRRRDEAAQAFRTLLMLAGLVLLAAAGWMVTAPLGVAVAGVLLVALPLVYVRVMRG